MRITSWNVNGLRAAARKGLAKHLEAIEPDVLLLQEIRATPEQLEPDLARPRGWQAHWHPAEKLGYAGVATWSRNGAHERLGTGIDGPDPEGRVLRTRVGGVQLVNVYLPSGSSGPDAQARKEAWMDVFLPWSERIAATDEPVVLAGDLNIAHTELDIHNATANRKNSGFLPHERAWFGELLGRGWTDLVRAHLGPIQGPYSWWSNRGNARALDRGWRIDYLLGNAAAAARLAAVEVRRAGGLEISDHAPVTVELNA